MRHLPCRLICSLSSWSCCRCCCFSAPNSRGRSGERERDYYIYESQLHIYILYYSVLLAMFLAPPTKRLDCHPERAAARELIKGAAARKPKWSAIERKSRAVLGCSNKSHSQSIPTTGSAQQQHPEYRQTQHLLCCVLLLPARI